MAGRPLRNLGVPSFLKTYPLPPKRSLHACSRRSAAASIPFAETPVASSSTYSPSPESLEQARVAIRESRHADLAESLSRDAPNPSRVWGRYIDLLSFIGSETLPLHVHQAVLRKCVPPTKELRASNIKRLQDGTASTRPHKYEERMQLVIHHMDASGHKPTLDDYNFVLEQFAAVGHCDGAMEVYKELVHKGYAPTPRTYGLCLQAIAYKQTLPCRPHELPGIMARTTRMCTDLLREMFARGIPFTSVNFDLALRVLKEATDDEGFAALIRTGYGIDLAYPDQQPLEHVRGKTKGARGRDIAAELPQPLPFSTAALNTIIDVLGRRKKVPRMVVAFEVLTVPLPPHANEHFSSTFDDDDDFGVRSPPESSRYRGPHAEPNITTYNLMIKHMCSAGHATLARHYMVAAMHVDYAEDRRLRGDVMRLPLHEIAAPHFSVNRGTFLPAYGLANRDKNLELMRWVLRAVERSIRRKKERLAHYTAYRDRVMDTPEEDIDSNSEDATSDPSSIPQSDGPSPVATDPIDSSASSPLPADVPPAAVKPARAPPVHILDVDLDAPPPPPPREKMFDLSLHLTILERDLSELADLHKIVQGVLGRSTQRVKERIGRRVWANKDVYLRSEPQRRVLGRNEWMSKVNYKPADKSVVRALEWRRRKPSQSNGDKDWQGRRPFSTQSFALSRRSS
ncbi:hypothetical protein PLICRDRAFT_129139 [Plicaturopsis crispa FD-325 SS-3]|nr:hypothetical protein PLICRDRAFT_129139 [Plicaturopsis crispa FD-325 SS-3]